MTLNYSPIRKKIMSLKDSVRISVDDSICGSVWYLVFDFIWAPVRDSFLYSVWGSLRGDRMRSTPINEISAEVDLNIESDLK